MATRVSVCICAYNAAGRIGAVLDALSRQAHVPADQWEVIVVDNNSNDATAAVCAGLFSALPCRARLVREERQGLSFARRTGFDNATGDVVAYVDDDNVVAPDWVCQCARFFAAHPAAGIVGGRVLAQCCAPLPAYWPSVKWMLAIRDDLGDAAEQVLRKGSDTEVPCGAGMCVRRAALGRVYELFPMRLSGRRGSALSSGEDIEIGLRILELGWEGWYCPEMVLWHIIPEWRLSKAYLYRLRFGIVKGSVVTGCIAQLGAYPPRLIDALKHLWWVVVSSIRNVSALIGPGVESSMLRASTLGRLAGVLIEVRAALGACIGRRREYRQPGVSASKSAS